METVTEYKPKNSLDDVLGNFGMFKPYHLQLLVMLGLAYASNVAFSANFIFAAEEVGYRCADANFTNNTCGAINSTTCTEWIYDKPDSFVAEFQLACQEWKRTLVGTIRSVAYMLGLIFVGPLSDRCADANFTNNTCGAINSTTCTEWIYDKPDSFVAEFQLACQEWKRTLVGTIRSVAYMLGLIFVGPLSDRIGRKSMIVVTGVLGGILGVAKSFVTSYWLYIVLEFCESGLGDIHSPVYILNVEIVSNKQRVPYFTYASLGYCLGAVYIALLAWLMPNWRIFLRVLYGPALLFIFYLNLVDESPRWLLAKGKKAKAVKIIEKIAKKNKVSIEPNVLDNLPCETKKGEEIKFSAVLKSTFSSRTLIQRFIICVVWWITSTFVNYGMSITSVSLQGNSYANYALVALTEIPGSLLTMVVLMKFRRKYPLIVSFLTAGLFCVGQPFLPINLAWISIMIFMAGKLMANFYFNITSIYTSELFPTYTRNSMQALCSSLGRIGSIVAPQTPLLTVYWVGLPSLVFGIVSIIAGLLTFFVSDVADIPLPDTVEEAEAIGGKKSDETKHNV